MISRVRKRWLALAAAWLCAVSTPSFSCQVCVPVPTQTAADQIIAARDVVLARENPDKPFSFRAVDVVKGEIADPDIDLFANSGVRRLLAADPDRVVVLVRKSGLAWKSLGLADGEYQDVVLDIVRNSDRWAAEAGVTDLRMTYFVPLLGHPNRRIHELAYLEIGRASYADIKVHAHKWPAQDMRDLLNNPQMLEWFPLAIMILGMNAEPRDVETILSRISLAESYGFRANLAAWVTAYIEIQGIDAVARIESDFLLQPGRERDQLDPLLVALSVHGSNSPGELRDRVVDAYLRMLEVHPQMVATVTRDLAAWKRWDTSKIITGVMENWPEADPMSDFAVKSFLYQADRG